MDLSTLSNVASVLGLTASIAIAIHQNRQARAARKEANQERDRAVTLEEYLSRQRWQQLRSLGEQIDDIERSGRHNGFALDAALHARLKEQFSSLLGLIATSTRGYSSTTVRHWVHTGRLKRPWQVAEAISHVELPKPGITSEDDTWVRTLLNSARGGLPAPVEKPRELDEEVAAYILVADSVRADLTSYIAKGGQAEYNVTVLLAHLARDCVELSDGAHGRMNLVAWGAAGKDSLQVRLAHYERVDFWIMNYAAESAQRALEPFRDLFLPGKDLAWRLLIPTEQGATLARAKFPDLLKGLARLW